MTACRPLGDIARVKILSGLPLYWWIDFKSGGAVKEGIAPGWGDNLAAEGDVVPWPARVSR